MKISKENLAILLSKANQEGLYNIDLSERKHFLRFWKKHVLPVEERFLRSKAVLTEDFIQGLTFKQESNNGQ